MCCRQREFQHADERNCAHHLLQRGIYCGALVNRARTLSGGLPLPSYRHSLVGFGIRKLGCYPIGSMRCQFINVEAYALC
jgi:hypothetical protein